MKRVLILAIVMVTFAITMTSQTITCRGNFTGKGRETLTFTPVGYFDNNFIAEEDAPDIYMISGKYAPKFYFRGCYLTPAGVCDVDGDGRDELAFISSGMHGCWGGLTVLDYYQGQWHYLTTEHIPVYLCNDDIPANLISRGKKKNTFYAITWKMGGESLDGKKKLYPIKRKKYAPSFKRYFDANHRLVNL